MGPRRAFPAAWVCQRDDFPALKWWSSSDVSGTFPPITCERVERVPPGTNLRDWAGWTKILQLIDEFPF